LELSRNQVTHFYSKKKNTKEMIKMMNLLRTQYRHCSAIYLSWDAASWHISKQLFTEIKARNDEAETLGYPIVKTAPLPACAQFLNIIESVFSGMSRAVIQNSDYPSVEAAQKATIVDPEGYGGGSPGEIDGGEAAVQIQEDAMCPSRVAEPSHDLAAVVDPVGAGASSPTPFPVSSQPGNNNPTSQPWKCSGKK
jgi:hypothetical protein